GRQNRRVQSQARVPAQLDRFACVAPGAHGGFGVRRRDQEHRGRDPPRRRQVEDALRGGGADTVVVGRHDQGARSVHVVPVSFWFPPPLRGGSGWGVALATLTPLPSPPPQGGREKSNLPKGE